MQPSGYALSATHPNETLRAESALTPAMRGHKKKSMHQVYVVPKTAQLGPQTIFKPASPPPPLPEYLPLNSGLLHAPTQQDAFASKFDSAPNVILLRPQGFGGKRRACVHCLGRGSHARPCSQNDLRHSCFITPPPPPPPPLHPPTTTNTLPRRTAKALKVTKTKPPFVLTKVLPAQPLKRHTAPPLVLPHPREDGPPPPPGGRSPSDVPPPPPRGTVVPPYTHTVGHRNCGRRRNKTA